MISYWQLQWWLNEAVQVERGTFLETGNIRSASWHFRPRSCVNTKVVAQQVPSPLSIGFSHFLEKFLLSERLSRNVWGPCSINSAQPLHFKTQILVPNHSRGSVPVATADHFSRSVPSTGPGSRKWPSPFLLPLPQGKIHPPSWCVYSKAGSIVFTWDSLGGVSPADLPVGLIEAFVTNTHTVQPNTPSSTTPAIPFSHRAFPKSVAYLTQCDPELGILSLEDTGWQLQTETRGTRADICLVRPKANPMSCFCHCCLGAPLGQWMWLCKAECTLN